MSVMMGNWFLLHLHTFKAQQAFAVNHYTCMNAQIGSIVKGATYFFSCQDCFCVVFSFVQHWFPKRYHPVKKKQLDIVGTKATKVCKSKQYEQEAPGIICTVGKKIHIQNKVPQCKKRLNFPLIYRSYIIKRFRYLEKYVDKRQCWNTMF